METGSPLPKLANDAPRGASSLSDPLLELTTTESRYIPWRGFARVQNARQEHTSMARPVTTPGFRSLVPELPTLTASVEGESDPNATPVPVTPVVTVEATTNAAEPSSNGEFTLTRSGDTTAALTVAYTVDDTVEAAATPDSDYTALSGTATFAAGSATTTVTVAVMDDLLAEGEEKVVLTLIDGAAYDLGTAASATVFMADNETNITLVGATTNIPVNANKTNNSSWRFVGGTELVGLPLIRDFDLDPIRDLSTWNGAGTPPTGTAIVDPELKKFTATVGNGAAVGEIKVQVTYTDPVLGGRIRLWADQTKTTEIVLDGVGILGNGGGKYAAGTGTLPNYPVTEFYIEGTRPSLAADDITIRVTSIQGGQAVTRERKLTVTPVVAEFSVNPKDPPSATFMKTGGGNIAGMNSGEQSADGAAPGSGKVGVTYTADLRPAGSEGRGVFVQNVTGLINGPEGGITFSDGTVLNVQLKDCLTFPILDKPLPPGTAFTDPFYQSPAFLNIVGPSTERHNFVDVDTPFFADAGWGGIMDGMSITFQARMYLVWKYSDNTLFTLAQADWQVVFHSTKVPLLGNIILPDSLVSASPTLITNADPAKLVGAMYNGNVDYVPVP